MVDRFDVEAYQTWKTENKETTAELAVTAEDASKITNDISIY